MVFGLTHFLFDPIPLDEMTNQLPKINLIDQKQKIRVISHKGEPGEGGPLPPLRPTRNAATFDNERKVGTFGLSCVRP